MALVERLSEWISTIMLLNRQKENEEKCDITHKLIFKQYKYLCNVCLVLCWNQSDFCYWLKQLFFSWNAQHCEGYCPFSCAWRIRYLCISISYLCNINVMNAMNNEIFNAESVITYLKGSCCFPLVTTGKCSNTSIPLTAPLPTATSFQYLSQALPKIQPVQGEQPMPLAGWSKQEFSCLGSICWMLPTNPKVGKLIPQLDLIHLCSWDPVS